jgi:hypothetical protein
MSVWAQPNDFKPADIPRPNVLGMYKNWMIHANKITHFLVGGTMRFYFCEKLLSTLQLVIDERYIK